jgi:hypothetical protein
MWDLLGSLTSLLVAMRSVHPLPPQVRTLVRERLGETPLMAQGMGHKVRKKRKAAPPRRGTGSGEGRPGTSSSSLTGAGPSGALDSDRASLVSAAYTYRTASTYKTKASQPDFLRIPAEYDKVRSRYDSSEASDCPLPRDHRPSGSGMAWLQMGRRGGGGGR